ncbi:MAG: hypothetical protein RLN69_10785, partial [Woeseiaceae bacterium]
YTGITLAGRIVDGRIVEACGLARSHLVDDRLWVLNDGGSGAHLFAIDHEGKSLGSIELRDSNNRDWEDLASFEHEGKAWLLVADIGDNSALRRYCTLYIVEEPREVRGQSVVPARSLRFTYPDGPRDAESVSVDVDGGSVFVLVKRTIPARLYRIQLFPADDPADDVELQLAESIGDITSIPQPGNWDIVNALARSSWHWQPTAMDFSRDGRRAAILTYVGLYVYKRNDDASWFEALQQTPQSVSLGEIGLAEAVAFGPDDSIFVTVEGPSPPLYRAIPPSDPPGN